MWSVTTELVHNTRSLRLNSIPLDRYWGSGWEDTSGFGLIPPLAGAPSETIVGSAGVTGLDPVGMTSVFTCDHLLSKSAGFSVG